MTSFLRSSAPKGALLAAVALLLAGCGCSSGSGEEALDAAAAARAAEKAFAGDDYATAVDRCRQSLAQAPDQQAVLVLQARAAMAGEDDAAAAEAVARLVELLPQDAGVRQLEAELALGKGDWNAARAAFTKIAEDTSLPASLRSLGFCGRGVAGLRQMGAAAGDALPSHEEIRLDFMRAIQADRRNASAYYNLAYFYAQEDNGFKQAAIDLYDRYVGLMGKTDDPHVAKAKGASQRLKKDLEVAQTQLLGTTTRNTGACADAMRKADTAFRSYENLKKKNAAKAKDQLAIAVKAYEESLRHDPLSYEALTRLVGCLNAQGTAESRKKAFDASVRMCAVRRGDGKVLLAAGDQARRLGKSIVAVQMYSKAVALKWNDLEALERLASALRACGRNKEAAAYQQFRDSLAVRK